jgi:two-component system chemotaxis response regulator CheY
MIQALVVDDSAVIRKVVRRIFEGMQFETTEAEDGERGLQACAFLMPDLIFVDWNMPVLDGFGFIRQLRKMPGGNRPKILFCTSENDIAHIARAMHAGADDHILKPFDRALMQAKVESIGFLDGALS